MAHKKATSGSILLGRKLDKEDKYTRPKSDEERVARKRLRRVKTCRLAVYELPDQAKLDAYATWAIVRQSPERARVTKKLDHDPDARWWLPVTWSSCDWSQVFWLDVVSVKIAGRLWPSLCRACDLTLLCAEEGRGINPRHECSAKRSNLVDIARKKKEQASVSFQAPGR